MYSPSDAYVGSWVRVRGSDLGFAYCHKKVPGGAVVVYTDIPGRAEVHRTVSTNDLMLARVSPETRVWVKGKPYGWHAAEVVSTTAFGDFRVRVAGMPSDLVMGPGQFTVRWHRPLTDPVAAVSEGFCDSPEFYEARSAFLDHIVLQHATCKGYVSILSAPVEHYQHQLDTVSRVLSDPVMRYLLADEVGLGKTIEASLIVKQLLHDDDRAIALISVPTDLRKQWGEELRDRFLLGPEIRSDRLRLISHEEMAEEASLSEYTIVVIDEAHRFLEHISLRPHLRNALHRSKGLLLLSATPMSGDPGTLHGLLNLIDPTAYPADGLASFQKRVHLREREAANIQVLTSRRAGLRQKRVALDELRVAHGSDPTVTTLADRCLIAEDPTSPLWSELGGYIRETYRISRRMIRHRRDSGIARHYPTVGRNPVFVALEDPTRAIVDDFLDRYREHIAETSGDVTLIARMVLHALGGPRSLLHHLRNSLTPDREDRTLIEAMVARLDMADTGARTRLALNIVADRLSEDYKVVVVGTSTDVAREFYETALAQWPGRVSGHLMSTPRDIREREIQEFLNGPGGHVLVGDHTIEEGRNFQEARVLVNLDLPLDPNRLEQRIGRLDRFGARGTPAEIVVIVEPDSLWVEGHIRMLREGIGIFDTSVATLQRRLTLILHEMITGIPEKGSDVFSGDLVSIKEGLESERVEVDLLEELESVTAASDFDDVSMDDLRRLEGNVDDLRSAFLKLTGTRGGIGLRSREDQMSLLRFQHDQRRFPGLPDDAAQELLPLLSRPRAYARAVATEQRGVAPLRVGDPLMDWIEQHLRADERGRAHAIVRSCDLVQSPSLWLRCDVLVEFDASHLQAESEAVLRRLRRRGDALLAPSVVRAWSDTAGGPSAAVQERLDVPFDTASDRVLRGWVWEEVLTALPDWRQLCQASGEAALKYIRSLPILTTAPEEAARKARREVSARVGVLTARSHRLPTYAEREAARLELERETAIGDSLIKGVADPAVSVVACSAVVLWPAS